MEEISTEMIDRCRDGDMEAFAGVVQRYERPIYSFVYRILHHSAHSTSTEDVVQEVFLKVYRKIHTYDLDRGRKFSTWLFTIARNHCISLLRKKSVESRRADFDADEFAAIPDSGSPNPRDAAREAEVSETAARAVASLPERIRSAFVLKHYEGLSYNEIGAIMGCSSGTVKSRVARAKAKLMRELEDHL